MGWRMSPESRREPGMPESVACALQPQFRHARLESRGLEAELIGGAAGPANPPSGAIEHALDVLFLHVCQPDAASGAWQRTPAAAQSSDAGRWRRSQHAPPGCAARGHFLARSIAATPRCCLSGSTRCASRTPTRTPRRSATPASGCPRSAPARAAPESERRSAGSTGLPGTGRSQSVSRDPGALRQ